MTRPIFLLDVDGVINCFPTYIPEDERPTELHTFEAEGFTINVRPTVAEWLQALAENDRVEIRWLTTWGHLANHSLVPHLNLPEFKVQAEQPRARFGPASKSEWWKLDAVHDLLEAEPDRRIIWADDEISRYAEAISLVARVHDQDISRFLAVCPDEDRGLSDENIDLIERFISHV